MVQLIKAKLLALGPNISLLINLEKTVEDITI